MKDTKTLTPAEIALAKKVLDLTASVRDVLHTEVNEEDVEDVYYRVTDFVSDICLAHEDSKEFLAKAPEVDDRLDYEYLMFGAEYFEKLREELFEVHTEEANVLEWLYSYLVRSYKHWAQYTYGDGKSRIQYLAEFLGEFEPLLED